VRAAVLAVGFAAIALAGCQPSRHPLVYLDSDFTSEEVDALIAGSEEWSSHAELGLDFHVFLAAHGDVSGDPTFRSDTVQVVRMRGLECPFGDPPQWATPEHGGALGLTKINPVSTSRGVCLNAAEIARRRESLANAFAHELGHVFGLQHVTDRTSVMTPAESVGVQAADVAWLQDKLGK
jgi:hypothetical protein